MPASLANNFISDLYTSLLHLSGLTLGTELDYVYDGAGNQTGIALSGTRVVINNIIQPQASSITEFIDFLYPVGSILLTTTTTNPSVRFTGTTWTQVAQGKFLVGTGTGSDGSTSKTFTTGSNSGNYSSTLPPHIHGVGRFTSEFNNDAYWIKGDWDDGVTYTMRYMPGDGTGFGDVATTGTPYGIKTSLPIEVSTSQTLNITPPSYGIYIWQRTT